MVDCLVAATHIYLAWDVNGKQSELLVKMSHWKHNGPKVKSVSKSCGYSATDSARF